jgi:hypothetical protein
MYGLGKVEKGLLRDGVVQLGEARGGITFVHR